VSKSRSVRTLQRTLYVLAVIPVVAGASTVLLGSESVPAAGKPTASIESELRFYSVWWIGAGLFLAWLAPRIEERTRELRVFCALLFLAGLSRVLAILDVGWPRPSQIMLMALEFSIPAILVVWQATVVRSSLEGHNQPER
jgi:hypothetical protein